MQLMRSGQQLTRKLPKFLMNSMPVIRKKRAFQSLLKKIQPIQALKITADFMKM